MGNLYLGSDAMPWSDCVKYLVVHFKCATTIKGDFTVVMQKYWDPVSSPSVAILEMTVIFVLHHSAWRRLPSCPRATWLYRVRDDTGLSLSDVCSCAPEWTEWKAVTTGTRLNVSD